jgi:hypothetical protein
VNPNRGPVETRLGKFTFKTSRYYLVRQTSTGIALCRTGALEITDAHSSGGIVLCRCKSMQSIKTSAAEFYLLALASRLIDRRYSKGRTRTSIRVRSMSAGTPPSMTAEMAAD